MSSAPTSLVEEFGPFARVFEVGGPSYLGLLNMNLPKCRGVLQLVQTAIESGEDPGRFIRRLLTHVNWGSTLLLQWRFRYTINRESSHNLCDLR